MYLSVVKCVKLSETMIVLMSLRSVGVFAVCGTEILSGRPSRGHGKTSNPALHALILLSHHGCIQDINVCLQNHHWLCTPLLQTYVPLEACVLQVNVALLFIETQNHFHWLLH